MDSYHFTKTKQYKFLSHQGGTGYANKTFSRKDSGLKIPKNISNGGVRYTERKQISPQDLKVKQRHYIFINLLAQKILEKMKYEKIK